MDITEATSIAFAAAAMPVWPQTAHGQTCRRQLWRGRRRHHAPTLPHQSRCGAVHQFDRVQIDEALCCRPRGYTERSARRGAGHCARRRAWRRALYRARHVDAEAGARPHARLPLQPHARLPLQQHARLPLQQLTQPQEPSSPRVRSTDARHASRSVRTHPRM
eukprot:3459344-Pleurochrysis_carterae.AAC.1